MGHSASKKKAPLVTAAIIVGVASISGWVVSWWRTLVGRSAMAIDVGVSRRVVATIRIIKTAAARRWVVINRRAGSGRSTAIATAVVVIVAAARWASITVSVTSRGIRAGRSTAVIIIGIRSTSRRAGTGSVSRDIRLGLYSVSRSKKLGRDGTNVSDTGDLDTLEFAAIQFFYCVLEVCSSFELDEASEEVSRDKFEV